MKKRGGGKRRGRGGGTRGGGRQRGATAEDKRNQKRGRKVAWSRCVNSYGESVMRRGGAGG